MANKKGSILLHFICSKKRDDGLAGIFFKLNDKNNQQVEVNARDESGRTPLHLALQYANKKLVKLLLRRSADTTLVNAKGDTPLDMICKGHRDDADLAKMLFEIGDEKHQPVKVDELLQSTVANVVVNLTKLLLRRGANPNTYNKERCSTLSQIFEKFHDDDLRKIISEMIDEQHRVMPIDTRETWGNHDTLLHLALRNDKRKTAELLLRRGADSSLANAKGETPLHIICQRDYDAVDLARLFFDIVEDIRQIVPLDARNSLGNTPLHMALRYGRKKMIKLLLERGADPNLANKKGSTLIHIVCDKDYKIEFAQMLLSQKHQRVLVDVLDNDGNTPLTLSLEIGRRDVAELLLKYGANLNFANNDGETLLHIFCRKINLLRILFELCDEQQLQVQVDAVDKFGRTPLQLAVANLNLDAFDLLLDRGADVSRFAFPTESYYGAGFDSKLNYSFDVKLKMASGALAILDSLEKRGYELDGSDALTIMKFFAKHGLFETSPDLQQRWYDEKEFASKAKKKIMKPGLSLYGLIQLRPDEAAKELTYRYYHELACAKNYPYFFSNGYQKIDCSLHLCEKLSRGFFRGWAMESFMKLIHYRLPLECCDMIVDHLKNEDLCNICLAAADETVRGDGNSNRPVNISDSDTDSDGHF
uniref:Uncharacterized protein n=2 Tax=Trichogramma kaykai TaxID=54128 RepID=A0ABD2X9X3_9HYME